MFVVGHCNGKAETKDQQRRRELPSLRHYVLVKQEEAKIQVYSRQSPTALWNIRVIEGLESLLDLDISETITLNIPLIDIYDRIVFEK